MNEEELSPMENFVRKIIVNQAKNTMINSIRNTDDIEWLKQEFEKTLREKWGKEKQLKDNWNKLKEWLEEEIYNIEPKGTAINYNCEYDSEEDYINAMKERSKLLTLKRVLINLQEIEKGEMNE